MLSFGKIFLFFILLFLTRVLVVAQEKVHISPEWKIKSLSFLDNREYFNAYTNDQTMFGNGIDITGGFRIDTLHLFQVGVNFLYEFGSEASDIKIFPVIYYKYQTKYTNFLMGSFPRFESLDYPNVLLLDTLYYYRPNIEGSLFAIKGKYGFQNMWIDWTGRQSASRNESFLAGSSGKFQYQHFYFENYLYMYHHAATSTPDTSFHLRDNGGGVFQFGIDYSKKFYTKISAGLAFSYDRQRPQEYDIKKGFYGKLETEYHSYLVRIIHYQGESLSLAYGDSFYKANKYTRIDTEFKLINHSNIQLQLQLSGHLFDDEINFSQKLLLFIKLN
jgi:hypothetical protein